MLKNRLFSCFVMLLWAFASTATPKENVRITGIVKDDATGNGLAFVSVVLMNKAGEVIIAGATNEQGAYVLSNIRQGSYILKISSTGYNSVLFPLEISGEQDEIINEPVVLETENKQLNSVTITAKRPLLERKIDKLVMNVADAVYTEGSNGMDVLRKAPGVMIDQLGNVLLNGQQVAVWIDNRPSNLSGQDLLSILGAMDGSNINKIELIANPSAKYDAEGVGGIINILTKKNFLQGVSGTVKGSAGPYFERGGDYRWSGGGELNYRNNWWNSSVTYDMRQFKGFSIANATTEYGQLQRYTYQFNDCDIRSQTARWGNDFFLDKKNTFGLTLSGIWTDADFISGDQSDSKTYENGILTEQALIKGTSGKELRNYAGNLNYQHDFDDLHDLLINADYMHYIAEPWQKERNYFDDTGSIPKAPLKFNNNAKQAVDIISFRADYTYPLGSSTLLEAGGKYAQSLTDNALHREDSTTSGGWQFNDSLSNAYRYDERVTALYASVWTQLTPKWSCKVGMRFENTWSKGDWQSNRGDTTTHQQYYDFFPSLFVNYALSAKHNFSFSYSRRIHRPGYESLNPFRLYAGAYTYEEGNPGLLPEYTNTLNIGYTYNQFLNVSLLFLHTRQVMTQVMSVDTNTSVTSIVWQNFGKTNFPGLSVSMSQVPVTKWWTFSLYLNGYYVQSIAPDYNNSRFYGTIYFENNFMLGNAWRAEVGVNAQSKVPQGYFVMYPMYSVWAGVRKTLWEGKASLSLFLNDAFNSSGTRGVSDRNGQRIDVENKMTSRILNFSFTYRFGKKDGRQRIGSELEESSRLSSGDKK